MLGTPQEELSAGKKQKGRGLGRFYKICWLIFIVAFRFFLSLGAFGARLGNSRERKRGCNLGGNVIRVHTHTPRSLAHNA
jgi:hypothetical protein